MWLAHLVVFLTSSLLESQELVSLEDVAFIPGVKIMLVRSK